MIFSWFVNLFYYLYKGISSTFGSIKNWFTKPKLIQIN